MSNQTDNTEVTGDGAGCQQRPVSPFIMRENETMGDYWKDVKPALKERSREKKSRNWEHGVDALKRAGVEFTTKDDNHYIITKNGQKWDYWPTTGKWSRRVKGPKQRYSRGIRGLLKNVDSFCG